MRIAIVLHDYSLCHRFAPIGRLLKDKGHDVRTFSAKPVANGDRVLKGFEPIVDDWTTFNIWRLTGFDPERVLIWNGHYPHISAACSYIKRNYMTFTMEQGWLPQRGHSYIADDLAQYSEIRQAGNAGGTLQPEQKALLEELRESYKIVKPVGLPEKYVFVPLQLEYDTQITLGSNPYKTMNSLLGYVLLMEPNLPVIYKEHPLLPTPRGDRPAKAIRYTGELRSIDLAVHATKVIGINSTLLVESHLFNKTTMVLGDHICDGFYQASRDEVDYKIMALLLNQFETANPPAWVVDKIVAGCFSPRLPS